jgi:hypothetical protein
LRKISQFIQTTKSFKKMGTPGMVFEGTVEPVFWLSHGWLSRLIIVPLGLRVVMTSLRVALKLSMAEVKPDEKSSKRKNPLLVDKKVEEPTLDDLLSGRKRKSSFDSKEPRSKYPVKDGLAKPPRHSRSGESGRSESPAEESIGGRSEGSAFHLDNNSLTSEDHRRQYVQGDHDHDSELSVQGDDGSIADEGSVRPLSSNEGALDGDQPDARSFVSVSKEQGDKEGDIPAVITITKAQRKDKEKVQERKVEDEMNYDAGEKVELGNEGIKTNKSSLSEEAANIAANDADSENEAPKVSKKRQPRALSALKTAGETVHLPSPRGRADSGEGGGEGAGEFGEEGGDRGGGGEEEDGNTQAAPRYQSSRAAAMVAKTRISTKGPGGRSGSIDELSGLAGAAGAGTGTGDGAGAALNGAGASGRKKKAAASAAAAAAAAAVEVKQEAEVNWVQCDSCEKWRSVAPHIDQDELPEQWFCHLNSWDPQFSTCDAEAEDEKDAIARFGRSKLAMMAAEEGAEGSGGGGGGRGGGRGGGAGGLTAQQQQQQQQRVWLKGGINGRGRWRKVSDLGVVGDEVEGLEEGEEDEDNNNGGGGSGGGNANAPPSRKRLSSGGAATAGGGQAAGVQRASSTGSLAASSSSSATGSGGGNASLATGNAVPSAVNWVMCNKCRKWRKVPESIDVDALPEKWFCSLNTWNPSYARCNAKQEPDDPVVVPGAAGANGAGAGGAADKTGAGGGASNRGRRAQGGNASSAAAAAAGGGVGTIKQENWVQCERRNCKKWRKVPGSIDIDSLPEKWFCEMNTWDLDAASCDAPEASDSENEQPNAAASRQQLILANSKGANTLSYRRIIFGTDGRIRVCFSDKNKNGYGIFSHSEAHKPSSNDGDDYTAPTRRVSYWWSGAYDEASGFASATLAQVNTAGGRNSLKKQQALAALENSAAVTVPYYLPGALPGNRTAACSSSAATAATGGLAGASSSSMAGNIPPPPTYLLDAARRLFNMPMQPMGFTWPKKLCKSSKILSSMSLLRRQHLEATVIMSCFMASPAPQLQFTKLLSVIQQSRFPDPAVEACRQYLGPEGLKLAVKRLEDKGLVEVSYTHAGQLAVDVLQPVAQMTANCAVKGPLSASVATGISPAWTVQGVPLKMRKFHRDSKYKGAPPVATKGGNGSSGSSAGGSIGAAGSGSGRGSIANTVVVGPGGSSTAASASVGAGAGGSSGVSDEQKQQDLAAKSLAAVALSANPCVKSAHVSRSAAGSGSSSALGPGASFKPFRLQHREKWAEMQAEMQAAQTVEIAQSAMQQ